MLKNMGKAGENVCLHLINKTYIDRTRPQTWNCADIQPIPKPKEPGSFRPISLLSCVEKTAEKMVLNRLKHQLGPLHARLYAFQEKVGTTECIADFLSCINGKPAVVVFIDLEKAFELANPAAILASLAAKGIKGCLLNWVKNYCTNRSARVRFQGEVSSYKDLENGTPQGGILSPFLFNILMENIIKLILPNGVDLFSYADDFGLVSRGPNRFGNAQKALRIISSKCDTLGVKINSAKTKAMAIKSHTPQTTLSLFNQQIEWVPTFTYLGIILDQKLTFDPQIKYLKHRANTRFAAMRKITSLKQGAGGHILKTYYMATTRSLIDYGAINLTKLTNTQTASLEVIQNNAMRLMQGAPMWTRICNLQAESNLPPLATRIKIKNTHTITKTLLQRPNSLLAKRVNEDLNMHPELAKPNNYASTLGSCIKHCNLETTLKNIKADIPSNVLQAPAPWEDFPAIIHYTQLPAGKNNCSTTTLKNYAERSISSVEKPNSAIYYTDGTVDPATGKSGAGVYSQKLTASWRTSNSCSTLQTELTAIKLTLNFSITQDDTDIVIHTDSKSSLQALQNRRPKENVILIKQIINLLCLHKGRGKQVTLNWIPSHLGIYGNDQADKLAKESIISNSIASIIQPSLSQYKGLTKSIPRRDILQHLNYWVDNHSASAQWYKSTTNLTPSPTDKFTPRDVAVMAACLRLGYLSCWQVIQPINPQKCKHCEVIPPFSLFHYLLECPSTHTFRANLGVLVDSHHTEAKNHAIKVAQNILSNLDSHIQTLREFELPR